MTLEITQTRPAFVRRLLTPDAVTGDDISYPAESDRNVGELLEANPLRRALTVGLEVFEGTALVERDVILYLTFGSRENPSQSRHEFLLGAGQSLSLSAEEHPQILGACRFRFVDNSADPAQPAYANATEHVLMGACEV